MESAAGRIENCQIGVFLADASRRGHALIDRELYLPDSWLGDRVHCREAAILDGLGFRTKPALARVMLERALEAELPVGWVTTDELYGGDGRLRRWPEEREVPHVLAIKRSEALWSMRMRQERAFNLATQVPAGVATAQRPGTPPSPPRLRLGPGGDPAAARAGLGARLLVRRSLRDGELAFYVCYAPAVPRWDRWRFVTPRRADALALPPPLVQGRHPEHDPRLRDTGRLGGSPCGSCVCSFCVWSCPGR